MALLERGLVGVACLTVACASNDSNPDAKIADQIALEQCRRRSLCGDVSLTCADRVNGSACAVTIEPIAFGDCLDEASEQARALIEECSADREELKDTHDKCYASVKNVPCPNLSELQRYYAQSQRDPAAAPDVAVLPASCLHFAELQARCVGPSSNPSGTSR